MSEHERYEKEFERLQPYVPFLQDILSKGGNGSTVHLQKVRTLLELITNKNRLTLEHIPKCLKALEMLQRRMAGLGSNKTITPQTDRIAIKLEKIDNLMSKAKVRETPDSPPPFYRLSAIDIPVVIPIERTDDRDCKTDIKDRHSERRHRESPSNRIESADRKRHQSSGVKRRSRWDVTVKIEPNSNESKSSQRLPAGSASADRSDSQWSSTDRHIPVRSSGDGARSSKDRDDRHNPDKYRPNETSRSNDRHSDTFSKNERVSDSSRSADRLPDALRSSDRSEMSRQLSAFTHNCSHDIKSVFNRLGEKISPKKYTNINICVNKSDRSSRFSKFVDKSNVPLSSEELVDLHLDNVGRFGECSTSSIEGKNLEELKKMREALSTEIQGWTSCPDKYSDRSDGVNRQPQPEPTQSTSKLIPPKSPVPIDSPVSSSATDLLNNSLFNAANSFKLEKPRPNEDPLSNLLEKNSKKPSVLPDPYLPNSDESSLNRNNSLVEMVKVAISVSNTDSIDTKSPVQLPLSPTALKAVQHVIPGTKPPFFQNPGGHCQDQSQHIWDGNYGQERPMPLLADPIRAEPQRLALKYNPKPRRSITNDLRNRDPRMNQNDSPSYDPPQSHPSPVMHGSLPQNMQHNYNNPTSHFIQPQYNQPPFTLPNGHHNSYQNRPHSNRNRPSWMQFEIGEAPPKTYGEYRKAKDLQRKQNQQKPPKTTSHPAESTTNHPPESTSNIQKSPISGRDTSPTWEESISPNSTVPSTNSNLARSQFDSIYRVNNYEKTANMVTSLNTDITQNFKIPKKKTSDNTMPQATEPEPVVEPAPVVSNPVPAIEPAVPVTRDPRKMNRDPRRNTTTRIYDTSESDNETTADLVDASRSPNCEVSSSQSSKIPDEMRPILTKLLKPELLNDNLMQILGRVLDEDQLKKIRQIVETNETVGTNATDATPSQSSNNQEYTDVLSDDIAMPADEEPDATTSDASIVVPEMEKKKKPPTKRKNELQKLNEDIRDMFISQSVINATGRRSCTISNAAPKVEDSSVSTIPEPVVQPKPARITRRRNTTCVRQFNLEPLQPLPALLIQPTKKTRALSDGEADDDEAPERRVYAKRSGRKSAPMTRAKTPTNRKRAPPKTPEPEPVPELITPTKRTLRSSNNPTVVLKKLTSKELAESCAPQKNTPKPADLKAAKKLSLIDSLILKNTDKEMHALNPVHCKKCLLCEFQGTHMVNHYTFSHPNAENYLARIPRDMVDMFLANKLQEAERCQSNFKQICVFCKDTRTSSRQTWANHFAIHTGETVYTCTTCKQNENSPKYEAGHRERCPTGRIVKKRLTSYTLNLLAYTCRLCNFTKFDKDSVMRHLTNQHSENEPADKILEIPLLRCSAMPMVPRKGDQNKSKQSTKTGQKRGAVVEETTDNDSSDGDDESTEEDDGPPVLKAEKPTVSKYNKNAFLAQPKQEDGLFDKDTMRIMNDISFSNSNTTPATPPPRTTGTSMADRLNERFKSAQKNADTNDSPECDSMSGTRRALAFDITHPSSTKHHGQLVDGFERAKTLCDDIIPIVIKRLDESETTDSPTTNEHGLDRDQPEVKADEDDDEWEDCSDDGSVVDIDESSIVAKEELPVSPKKQEMVSAIVPATRPEPQSQTTASVAPQNITINKNNLIHDTVNRLYKSMNAINKVIESTTVPIEQTTPAVVPAPIQVAPKVSAAPVSVKTINRIDNVGFSVWNDQTAYCCLIDGCGFETNFLANLRVHSGDHAVLWTGYCFMCDLQIFETPMKLFTEIGHMYLKHITPKKGPIVDTVAEKPAKQIADKPVEKPVLKIRRLSGDKLSGNAVATQPAPSSDLQIVQVHSMDQPFQPLHAIQPNNAQNIFVQINPIASPLSAQPSFPPPMMKITNVISLGAVAAKTTTPPTPPTPTPSMSTIPVQITVKLAPSTNTPQMDINMLKPYTTNKSFDICTNMLQPLCLFSLYKCMASDCSFSNSSSEIMYQHLRYHESTSAPTVTASWLECAYCDEKITSCAHLIKHTYDEHATSIFQCPYCFYRSCAAHNVLLHIGKMHRLNDKLVLVCHGNSKKTPLELPYMLAARSQNVKPIKCIPGCNSEFYILESFLRHLVDSRTHNRFFCSYCNCSIPHGHVVKHLLLHNIGIYECIYCDFAVDEVADIQDHLCMKHPSKLLYVTCRVRRKDKPNLTSETLDSTVFSYIGESVDTKVLNRCPYPDSQLSYASAAVRMRNCSLRSESITFKSPPDASQVIATKAQLSMEEVVNIVDVQNNYVTRFDHILNSVQPKHNNLIISQIFSGVKPTASPTPTTTAPFTITAINPATTTTLPEVDVGTAAGLSLLTVPNTKSRIAHVPTTTTTTPPSDIPPPTISKTNARSELVAAGAKPNGFPELPALNKPTAIPPRTDILQREIDQATNALTKGTGLEGSLLYRCAFPGCGGTGTDSKHFNVHMLKHTSEPESKNGYKCFHCTFVSKNIIGLKYHMKEHGVHRLFCFYCDHSGPILNSLLKHMNDTHKKSSLITFPVNPKRNDQNMDAFVVCPRGVRLDDLNRFVIGLIDRFKMKVTDTKKIFTPDEIDMIPRQPIMPHLISCGNCNYATKVRTNMTRHLSACTTKQIDSFATTVRRSDPVNPVPCLDTGEMHFDKMRNLACSSFGSNSGEDVCSFIPENKRFVCNAKGCHYQSLTESGLRSHLGTLHPNELNYECSHCSANLGNMNVDRIINHLRLHDSRIYKCTKCNFNYFSRPTVEKHISDAHPGSVDASPTLIVRALDDQRVASSQSSSGSSVVASVTSNPANIVYKWRCSLCPTLFSTRAQVVAHAQHAHSITNQYQCSVCNEMQSNVKYSIIDHINSKHPGHAKMVKYFFMRVPVNEAEENTPIWRRDENKVKHIRGILLDDDQSAKKKGATNKSNQPHFAILSVTSNAIMSGPEATYTDAPDTDDESTGVVTPDEDKVVVIVSDEDDRAAKEIKPAVSPFKRIRRESICISSYKRNAFTKVKDKKVGNDVPIDITLSLDTFRCDKCSFTCDTADALKTHTTSHVELTQNIRGDCYKSMPLVKDAFRCGYCDCTSNSVNTLKNHHNVRHKPHLFKTVVNDQTVVEQPKPIRIDAQTTAELVIDDQAFVYICKYCPKREETVSAMYRHWQQMHKFLRPLTIPNEPLVLSTKKFAFSIDLNIRCAKCSKRISYRHMRNHFLRDHAEGPCAALHMLDPRKCGICGFQSQSVDSPELETHFAEKHPLLGIDETTILDRPIVSINERTLRNIQITGHRGNHKCLYCGDTFEYSEDFELHHKESHPSSPTLVEVMPLKTLYGCTICDLEFDTVVEVVQHLQHHNLYKFQKKYQCFWCTKTCRTKVEVREHQANVHPSEACGWHFTPLETRMDIYNRIKVIFPNGFFLCKSELKDTIWGDMTNIVIELNRLEAEEIRMDVVIENRSKRKYSGEDSDSSRSSKASKSSSGVPFQHRQVAKRSSHAPLIKIEAQETESGAAHPTPVSHYGVAPLPVDLRRINTKMQFGGSEIVISCDRFAMLVDINPKLQLVPAKLADFQNLQIT